MTLAMQSAAHEAMWFVLALSAPHPERYMCHNPKSTIQNLKSLASPPPIWDSKHNKRLFPSGMEAPSGSRAARFVFREMSITRYASRQIPHICGCVAPDRNGLNTTSVSAPRLVFGSLFLVPGAQSLVPGACPAICRTMRGLRHLTSKRSRPLVLPRPTI